MDQIFSEQVQVPDAVVSVAFDKAWSFVEKDPLLALRRGQQGRWLALSNSRAPARRPGRIPMRDRAFRPEP